MKIEKLDPKKILAGIEAENQKRLSLLELFDTIDSTNSYLLTRAKQKALSGSICLAEQQTEGRGRRGRQWISPPGTNIYCSLLWHFYDLQQDLSALSLAIAVMVASALKKYGLNHGVQLKWPNDIWYAGKKLAGILLETLDQRNVVIGIGINVLSAPESENAISIAEIIQQVPPRNALVSMLINELLSGLIVFQQQGVESFLKIWRQHDMLFEHKVDVHLSDKIISGTMRGVDEKGKLVLEDERGELQLFCYGEVSVRNKI